jgi:hypothetical protein
MSGTYGTSQRELLSTTEEEFENKSSCSDSDLCQLQIQKPF